MLCCTLLLDCAHDSIKAPHLGHLFFAELHAKALFEHEDQFHVLKGIPSRLSVPRDVFPERDLPAHSDAEQLGNIRLNLSRRHCCSHLLMTGAAKHSARCGSVPHGTVTM